MLSSITCRSHTDFHPNLTINIESTGRTSFMPINKVWLLLWWSSRNLVIQYNFVVISCTEFYLNQAKNVENIDKILSMLLSVYQYSWILQLLNTIVCRSFPNFTQISQEVHRIWVKIYLYVEENTPLTELIITELWLLWHFFVVNSYTEFCENLTDYLVTDTLSQTDWQMDMVPT
jgi:hypothetical protein